MSFSDLEREKSTYTKQKKSLHTYIDMDSIWGQNLGLFFVTET